VPSGAQAGQRPAAPSEALAEAQRLQVTGTPTFFIGVNAPNDAEMKGTKLVGAQPYSAFKSAIDGLLAANK